MNSPSPLDPRRLVLAAAAGIALGLLGPSQASAAAEPPARLSQTGLFAAGASGPVRDGVVAFAPQYALWSDAADKRRWMRLPGARAIDARRPDAWDFPRGTLLWKEFSHAGRPVETRTIERLADGSWRFAAYVWRADGSDADLAPARGVKLAVPAAPTGRYTVPSRTDCLACHGSTTVPVLGVSALQLSGAGPRSGDSPLPLDLRAMTARGLLRGLPPALLAQPPQIAASSAGERDALGYLHANCGHCHNRSGKQAPISLTLAQSAADPQGSREAALRSALEAPSRYRANTGAGPRANTRASAASGADPDQASSAAAAPAIVPGNAEASLLVQRMRTRQPLTQMPPLGTELADAAGLALVSRWIDHDLQPRNPHQETR